MQLRAHGLGSVPRWPALAGALACSLLAACPSGLSDSPASGATAATVDEVASSVRTLGFDFLAQLPSPATDVETLTVGIDGVGVVTFVAFATATPADTVDGTGAPLIDAELTTDSNGVSDVFVACVDSSGQVLDTVLISRADFVAGGCRSGNAASSHPSITFIDNPGQICGNSANPPHYLRIAFESLASDLVPAFQDANGNVSDVFVGAAHVHPNEDQAGNASPGSLNLRAPNTMCDVDGSNNDMPIEIVSFGNGNAAADGPSFHPAIRADGMMVAFESESTNLLGGDTNAQRDVLIRTMFPPMPSHSGGCVAPVAQCNDCHYHDQRVVTLMSSATSGPFDGGDAPSRNPHFVSGINFDVIAFESDATDLVFGDTNGVRDVFFGVLGGSVTRASVTTNGVELDGASRNASVAILGGNAGSPDLLIAFESDASNLPRATNSTTNVYLRDTRGAGATTLLNQRIGPDGATLGEAAHGTAPADAHDPRINARGTEVAFETLADNLDVSGPPDQNGPADVVLADVEHLSDTGDLRVRRISVTSAGKSANGASGSSFVLSSYTAASGGAEALSTNLAAKFANVRCINCHGFNSTPRPASFPSVHAGDLWPPDQCNLCHRPAETGVAAWKAPPAALSFHDKTIEQICAQLSAIGDATAIQAHLETDTRILWALGNAQPTGECWVPSSGDPNDNPGNLKPAVAGGTAEWNPQVDAWIANGMQCVDFSGDGGDVVGYTTTASNLASSAGSVVGFPATSPIERVSKTSGLAPSGGKQVDGASSSPSVTGDDRFVVFETTAAISPFDRNHQSDVYVRDLFLGTTTLVSHAAASHNAANGASTHASAQVDSGGTLHVVFESLATNLVASFADNDGATAGDVFWASFGGFDGDSASISIALASGASGSATQGANGGSGDPSLGGAPNLFVAFDSTATDLVGGFVDGNGASAPDVFVRQLVGGSGVQLASHAAGMLDGGNAGSWNASSARSAGAVAFESLATDLALGVFTPGNASGEQDVFLWTGGALSLVSFASGAPSTGGDGASRNASVSDDGAYVAFESDATDLVAGFTDNDAAAPDVFGTTIASSTTTLLSGAGASATSGGNGGSSNPRVASSATALEVLFESLATDLGAAGDSSDTLPSIYSRIGATISLVSAGKDGQAADGACTRAAIGSAGGIAAFDSLATNLVGTSVDTNGRSDVFRVER